jgi:2-keto-4-pentenoate hydratase/2-oxohepta-3-ene-1,7-dioic acid hydratase in catechol pathway
MRICRFDDNRLGVVVQDQVRDVTAALGSIPSASYPFPTHDSLIAHLPEVRASIERLPSSAPAVPLASVKLLSPVANPGKIVAAPVNYRKHLNEVLEDPNLHHNNQINEIHRAGLFLKATSALIGSGHPFCRHLPHRRTDHEIELVMIIGKRAKDVAVEAALDYVAGYAIGLDMTIRGPEERSFRKSLDTYAVVGPYLVTADEISDPGRLDMELRVNGQVRQRTNTSELILGLAQLIAFASSFYTLHPGDVIFSGTCEGVGPVVPGDTLSASIQEIGVMTVVVEGAETPTARSAPA